VDKQWNAFFQNEAPKYLQNGFTKNTFQEVDFLISEMNIERGQSVLDIGCGTGRHCLELARRGMKCTGIDQSPDMLSIARAASLKESLSVDFIESDAATVKLPIQFDHAICLCEGAFSLLEVGADPVHYHSEILKNIHAMLKPQGMFLLTALNALRLVRKYTDLDISRKIFDIETTSAFETIEMANGKSVTVIEKGFMPMELKRLIEERGFKVLSIWGGTAGGWNKQKPKLDEIEIMAMSRRL